MGDGLYAGRCWSQDSTPVRILKERLTKGEEWYNDY
jgi:hypothetical protein